MDVSLKIKFSIIIFITIFSSVYLYGLDPSKKLHHYIHRSWQTIDGLPQNSANSIVQTDDGYIWIATQEGLTRFDGLSFKVFSRATNPEILSNDIRYLATSPDGALWITTYSGGAIKYKDSTFTTINVEKGLSENLVKTAYANESGDVWLGTFKNGINIVSNGRITHFNSLNGLPDNSIRAITGSSGNIWVGTLSGIALIQKGEVTKIYNENSGLENSNISSLFIDSQGTLWAGTKTGYLHFLKNDRFSGYKVPGSTGTDFVNVIFEDSDRNFWIGTEKGLHRFRNGSFETFSVEDGLTYNAVRSIFEDREKNLWVGTSGGGINLFSDGQITTLTTSDGLSSGDILPVLVDKSGNIWAGTANDGLDLITKSGRTKNYSVANGLTDNRILSLFETDNGEIWIGTVKGLNVLNPATQKIRQIKKGNDVLNYSVSSIISMNDGTILAGTHGDSLILVRNYEFFKNISRNEGINDRVILSMNKDNNGKFWIGTMNGLFYTDGISSKEFNTLSGLSSNTVYSLFIDSNDSVWAGTDSGLNIVEKGTVHRVLNPDFLYHDSIYSITTDSSGNLWLGSNKGLFKAELSEIFEKTLEKRSDFKFKKYGFSDGMKSIECNGGFTPAYAHLDGSIIFPTLNGLSVVDLKKEFADRPFPNVIIESVFSDDPGFTYNFENSIIFKAGAKKFEIKYTAPSFINPSAIKFKYKLDGFDNDFVEAQNRRVAYYTNLRPGEYTFRLLSTNSHGIWNNEETTLKITILPLFYQTLPFYIFIFSLLIIAISLPVIGYSRNRIKKVEEEKIELEKRALVAEAKYEKSRIDEEISVTYLVKLFEIMDAGNLYRNPNLTLKMLADRMKISHLYLSQIINLHTSMTFYTLLNMYRVLEVMEKLHRPEYKNESVITLAYEAGFNTKSAFNSVFKKFTGVTPTEYRKKIFL